MTTTLETIIKMQKALNAAIADLVAETYCQQETAPAAEPTPTPTPTSTNKEVKTSKKKNKSSKKETRTVNNDIRWIDNKSVRAAITHRACGERIPQWFLAGQTDATLKAMLAAPAGHKWGHRSGTTIIKVDSGAAKLNRERRKVAEAAPAKVVRSSSAPAPTAPAAEPTPTPTPSATAQVAEYVKAHRDLIVTPAIVNEALGLTNGAKLLANLAGAKCPAAYKGKVVRVAPGRYAAA